MKEQKIDFLSLNVRNLIYRTLNIKSIITKVCNERTSVYIIYEKNAER